MSMLVVVNTANAMLHLKIGDEISGTVIWADSDIDLSIVKIDKRRRPYFPKGTFLGDVRVNVSPWLPFRTKTVLCIFLNGKEAVVKKLGKYAICLFLSLVLSISNNSETVLSKGTRLFSSEILAIFFLPMILR